jgi:Rrf2 family protein
MLHIGKTVGYGVHALSCLEQAQGRPVLIKSLARQTAIGKPYLAKIINQLVHHGLVTAKRGRRGGIVLARPASQISLATVVEALEGNAWTRSCFFGMEACPFGGGCPAHNLWVSARGRLETVLRKTTLADLSKVVQGDPAWAGKDCSVAGLLKIEFPASPRDVRSAGACIAAPRAAC